MLVKHGAFNAQCTYIIDYMAAAAAAATNKKHQQ